MIWSSFNHVSNGCICCIVEKPLNFQPFMYVCIYNIHIHTYIHVCVCVYVIAMEFWSIQMDIAVALGNIQPIKKGMRNYVSHLLYADDMLVFLRASRTSMVEMNNLLQKLALNTELSMNKSKSKMYFSKSFKNKKVLSNLIGIPEGNLPTRYLGIHLSINYLKARHYSVLLDKCRMKIEGWAAHTLSFAGRIELIKTVLHGME